MTSSAGAEERTILDGWTFNGCALIWRRVRSGGERVDWEGGGRWRAGDSRAIRATDVKTAAPNAWTIAGAIARTAHRLDDDRRRVLAHLERRKPRPRWASGTGGFPVDGRCGRPQEKAKPSPGPFETRPADSSTSSQKISSETEKHLVEAVDSPSRIVVCCFKKWRPLVDPSSSR